MPKIETLHELMIHELRDIYSAEKQLMQALPKMIKSARAPALKDAFTHHLDETEEHVSRLEQVFELLGVKARPIKCKGMEGLIDEGKELVDEDIDPDVLDAGLIGAAQRIEHYEMAAYGTACEYARVMGHDDVVELLETTLTEEKQADRTLTMLSQRLVNDLAQHNSVM